MTPSQPDTSFGVHNPEDPAQVRTGSAQSFLLTAFLVGWVTYQFTLFDIGRFSFPLLLLTSSVLAVYSLRSKHFLTPASASLMLSTLLAWSVAFISYAEYEKTFTHLIQCLLTIGVMIGAQSLDWKRVFPRFRKHLLWIAAIVLAYGCYQFVARQHSLPLAFLPVTNQQVTVKMVEGEYQQRGTRLAMTERVEEARVSAFFPEPGNLAVFMLWVFAVGYGCTKGRTGLLLIVIGIAGVVLSQSMAGFIGLLLLPIIMSILRLNFRRTIQLLLIAAVVLLTVVSFLPPVFDRIATRATRIVTEREDYLLREKRFRDVADNFRIFLEAPFLGHGMASMEKVAPNNVVGDSFQTHLIERGLLGTFLYYAPFFWAAAKLSLARSRKDEVANVALMTLIVVIYAFARNPHVFFTPVYLTLGFALSQIPRHRTAAS